MEQKTGVRSLYAEFFRGYRADFGLFSAVSRSNSADNYSSPTSQAAKRYKG
jgi:hypothetical protein